jgi:formamidopyrimidine-DNA glycosylase
MPELPEVETVVRSLAPRLPGRRIERAEFRAKLVLIGSPARAKRAVEGARIESIARRGKHILIRLDCGWLLVHLGMTGKLLLDAQPDAYTRAIFKLDRGALLYNDVRMFGRIEVCECLPKRVERLGPEPLAIALEAFRTVLKRRSSRIKPLLLNQNFLGGIGNIYADESLFRARIHPLAIASRLGRERVDRLYLSIREVLTEAIESGGSSISDYVDAEGREGWFQSRHRVYGRESEPCVTCGAAVRRVVVAQRGTHYCPRCQRP